MANIELYLFLFIGLLFCLGLGIYISLFFFRPPLTLENKRQAFMYTLTIHQVEGRRIVCYLYSRSSMHDLGNVLQKLYSKKLKAYLVPYGESLWVIYPEKIEHLQLEIDAVKKEQVAKG